MSTPSPVSVAFHEAFDSDFVRLLARVGLAPIRPRNVKPGLIAAMVARSLAGARRLEVCLWCDSGTGNNMRLRADLLALSKGVECSEQIALKVPWPDSAAPRPRSLDFSGKEFLPGQDTGQLRKAIAFLAGSFVASFEALALAIPELESELQAAGNEPDWITASGRAAELWKTRHMRGAVDDRSIPGTIVFVGASLITVNADGQRLTFRFDTKTFNKALPLTISGWFLTPAGTRRATRLTAGQTTWHFDHAGGLSGITSPPP